MKARVLFVMLIFNIFTSNAQTKFNQLDASGQKEGLWKGLYPVSKRPRYEGVFSHGKEVGVFTFFDDTTTKRILATREFNTIDNSAYTIFYDTNKNKVSEGKVIGKLYEGQWKYYHKGSTSIMTIEQYKNKEHINNKMCYIEIDTSLYDIEKNIIKELEIIRSKIQVPFIVNSKARIPLPIYVSIAKIISKDNEYILNNSLDIVNKNPTTFLEKYTFQGMIKIIIYVPNLMNNKGVYYNYYPSLDAYTNQNKWMEYMTSENSYFLKVIDYHRKNPPNDKNKNDNLGYNSNSENVFLEYLKQIPKITKVKKPIQVATLFSGIGAVEQAFLRLKINHNIENGVNTEFTCIVSKNFYDGKIKNKMTIALNNYIYTV